MRIHADQCGSGSTALADIHMISNYCEESSDMHGSALWKTSWIRIRMEKADPDPGGKNRQRKGCERGPNLQSHNRSPFQSQASVF